MVDLPQLLCLHVHHNWLMIGLINLLGAAKVLDFFFNQSSG